jgi:uncharacterized RDD family membrane protein YckC
VELEDRITIATPEGVELGIVLAGAGSRFIASVIDLTVQLVLIGLAALVALALVGGGVGIALLAIVAFADFYLYDVLFEVLASGRTPGKRATHLRVVRERGNPVDLPASAIRNLLRVLDLLPGAYLVGLTSILLTRRNQRLGDLAAGTLVIRDGATPPGAGVPAPDPSAPASLATAVAADGWDVSAVSLEELAAVRRFLERRESLDRRARLELAHRLEQGLRAKVAGAPEELGAEGFLEGLVRVKANR